MRLRSAALEGAHLIDRLGRLVRGAQAGDGINSAQWEALRYLARANRFSKTPAALAAYFGSTRGTVSQTLIALEGKGLVSRNESARDKRSVELALTEAALKLLKDDPLLQLAQDIEAGGNAEEMADRLRATLHRLIRRNNGNAFGACATCRHFQRAVLGSQRMPHRCALLDEPLSEADSRQICVEQTPAAPS